MRVFFSHSQADRPLAAELRIKLEAEGLILEDVDEVASTGRASTQKIEDAVRSSDAVLLLINSHAKNDREQDLAWQAAVGAAWDNPKLRLLSVLLRDSELPAFVRSAASGDTVQAVRINDPRDLGSAARAILKLLKPNRVSPVRLDLGDDPDPGSCGSTGKQYPNSISYQEVDIGEPYLGAPADGPGSEPSTARIREGVFEDPSVETYASETDEDRSRRRQWLDEIRGYAKKLEP